MEVEVSELYYIYKNLQKTLPYKNLVDFDIQTFPYVNRCKCYKKLAGRSWPVLFTLTDIFVMHTLSSSAGK